VNLCESVYIYEQHRPGITEIVHFTCTRRAGHAGKHQAIGQDYKADGSGAVNHVWTFSWTESLAVEI
jgi:hypothetical protein